MKDTVKNDKIINFTKDGQQGRSKRRRLLCGFGTSVNHVHWYHKKQRSCTAIVSVPVPIILNLCSIFYMIRDLSLIVITL